MSSLSNECTVGREDEVLRDGRERPQSTVVDRTENSNSAAWLAIPMNLDLDLIATPGGASKLSGLGPTAQRNEFAVRAATVAIQMPTKHGPRFTVIHGACMSNVQPFIRRAPRMADKTS